MKRTWKVKYSHDDGRKGVVNVTTEIVKAKDFHYGNGKTGKLTIGDYARVYDLRYNTGDLHMVMLKDYFGKGLVEAKEENMRVGLLTGMLVKETLVTIKSQKTGKTIWQGEAVFANFNDTVKDWDFSNGHVIYI